MKFGQFTVEKSDIETKHHHQFSIEPILDKNALLTQVRGCINLAQLDLNHWISSGNLLGLYRDNHFIRHDTDIDVNVSLQWDTENTHQKIVEILTNFSTDGFYLVRSCLYKNHPMQLAYIDSETGVLFDMYFFYTGLEKDHALNITSSGLIRKPLKFIENLDFLDYGGYRFPIPAHIEEFLVWRFGKNWMEPSGKKVAWEAEATHLEVWNEGDILSATH